MAGKRGHNEGSVYRDGDYWTAAISYKDDLGRTKRAKRRFKSQRAAIAGLKQMHQEQARGLPPVVERQTVAQFLTHWLEHTARPRLRPKTHRTYEQIIHLYILPALGHLQLAKMEPQHLQALMNAMSQEGKAPRTVHHTRAVLRTALNDALKWGQVSRNIATLVDPPASRRYQYTILTPDQGKQLLDAARGDRLEAFYRVALSLGLRLGEALGLRWEDVDFEQGTIRVAQAVQRVGGRLQFTEPKSVQSRRTLPLPASLARSLRTHRARQRQERLQAGAAWVESGLIFTTGRGTPVDPRNASRSYKALLKRAGLPDLRFHDLRHSCASLLIAQGVHHRVVSELLGHSQISLTLGTYTHLLPEAQREAVALMDDLFPATAGAND